MKIIFTGIGMNGYFSLKALVESERKVVKVVVPEGYDAQEVEKFAKEKKLPLVIAKGRVGLENNLTNTPADLIIVASCPYVFRSSKLLLKLNKVVNVHGSFLPYYKGYHPIHWAIINDEKYSGVTIHFINKNVDSGDILAQKKIRILESDDINSLIVKISKKGASELIKVVNSIENGTYKPQKQKSQLSTLAPKRSSSDGKIQKKYSVRQIFNLVRALKSPYPHAFYIKQNGEKIEVLDTYKPGISGKVIKRIRGYYLVSAFDGVIMIKTNKELKIGEVLQ